MSGSLNAETKRNDWRLVLARYFESTPRIHVFGLAIVVGLSPVIVAINLWQPPKSKVEIAGGPSMDHAAAVTLVDSLFTWNQQRQSQDDRYQRLQQQLDDLLSWAPKTLSPIEVTQTVEQSLVDRNLRLVSTIVPNELATEDWTFLETHIQLTGQYHDLCHWLGHWHDAAVPAEAVSISVRPTDLDRIDGESIAAKVTLRFPARNSGTQPFVEADRDQPSFDSSDAPLEPMS